MRLARCALLILLLLPAVSACPSLLLHPRLDASRLYIALDIDAPLSQTRLDLVGEDYHNRLIIDNTSIAIPRPIAGNYTLTATLLLPSCGRQVVQDLLINEAPVLSYQSRIYRLRDGAVLLFVLALLVLCLGLIVSGRD